MFNEAKKKKKKDVYIDRGLCLTEFCICLHLKELQGDLTSVSQRFYSGAQKEKKKSHVDPAMEQNHLQDSVSLWFLVLFCCFFGGATTIRRKI